MFFRFFMQPRSFSVVDLDPDQGMDLALSVVCTVVIINGK